MRQKDRARDAHLPLLGASVVVTRPGAGASAIKRRVRQFGGSVISLPGVSLRGVGDKLAVKMALMRARASDIVIFVESGGRALRVCDSSQTAFPERRHASARSARRPNTRCDERASKTFLWPRESQTSEGLLALPELQRLRGKRVAIIGAPGGRELLVQSLQASKARVTADSCLSSRTAALSSRSTRRARKCIRADHHAADQPGNSRKPAGGAAVAAIRKTRGRRIDRQQPEQRN